MARSDYVYTVCWKESMVPLAVFTVKYQSDGWVKARCEKTGFLLEQFSRYRYVWGPSLQSGDCMPATLCPWENK